MAYREKSKQQKYFKDYYIRNKEKCKTWNQAWYAKNKEKYLARKRETQRVWYANNRHRLRGYKLKEAYGITVADFENMLQQQNCKCACCGKDLLEGNRNRMVDHCHDTGEIRGIVCMNCNIAEGCLKKDPDVFNHLLKYLKAR